MYLKQAEKTTEINTDAPAIGSGRQKFNCSFLENSISQAA